MKIQSLGLLLLTLLLGTGCRLTTWDPSAGGLFWSGGKVRSMGLGQAVSGMSATETTADQARRYHRQRSQMLQKMSLERQMKEAHDDPKRLKKLEDTLKQLELEEEGHGRRGGRESHSPTKRPDSFKF